MQQQFQESDEMITQVRSLLSMISPNFSKSLKPPVAAKVNTGAEKPVNVPELPANFQFTQPKVDATKRLNPKPKSWELPAQYLLKHQPTYSMGTIVRISEILNSHNQYLGQVVTIAGWARTVRKQANDTLLFIELNDGSTFGSLQVVVQDSVENFKELLKGNVGFSYKITGAIVQSPGTKQPIEMNVSDPVAHEVIMVGSADPLDYPMAKGQQNPETLRLKAHLRPRSNFIGAITRVRNNLAYATHQFYQNNGCLYIHTPLITCSDCEGAGEMFQVTTLNPAKIPLTPTGEVDYSKDFFKKPASLTVSGQLAVENYCCSLSNVYTFGPTFRAENSHTTRHLSEFWMIEPEFAFADLYDNMDAAESYVKFCINLVLKNNMDDLQFLDQRVRPGLIKYLEDIVSHDFVRCSYTEGIEILKAAIAKGAKFENKVDWGVDLNSEHERFLAEKVFKRPVFLYDYPKNIKAFYMKVTEDGKCVRAMDLLIPLVGELIGGSQREERHQVLVDRIKECGLIVEDYWWYLDLRKYGTVPHAGFGLGFERLVMMVTGVDNIRDVIPFPRYPGNAEF